MPGRRIFCPSFDLTASPVLDAILTSLGLVFLAEMGDKTQILALMLAARFQRPWPIIGGMVAAVLLNHVLAVGVGFIVADRVPADWLRWGVALSFILMAGWLLVPDAAQLSDRWGRQGNAFTASIVAFFIAEMGDKTQVATIALAARFHSISLVLIGSTVGMVLADAPVIWFGEKITQKIPSRLLRRVSAALFAVFGIAVFAGW
ncbi:MAG TPA: TMEM165/GDT1 family protein [Magnetospirillaceae bacterium]